MTQFVAVRDYEKVVAASERKDKEIGELEK